MSFIKGDIILPKGRTYDGKKLKHPAVVWDEQMTGYDDFMGIMLSKSGPDKWPDNVLMKEEHFSAGFYNNSHFVNQRFIKLASWGPFEKVGYLTEDGMAFIESRLSKKPMLPFEIYLASKKRS